jgi:uncharacterized protein (TIGR04255 family)
MPIPDSERVIYDKNPLESVICQVRFPPILKIEAEAPAAFQESIRKVFPLYSLVQPFAPGIELPAEIAKIVGTAFTGSRTHEFGVVDGDWKLTLSKESVALACSRYPQWEQFRPRFKEPLDALIREYAPAFFTRVGLRYRNVIRRSQLGLERVPWSELLLDEIAAEQKSQLADLVQESNHQILVKLPQNGTVRILHGIGRDDNGESCYLIDNDFFYDQKSEVGDALTLLDYFHGISGKLFRWCIKERLHNAMVPQVLHHQQR